MVEPNFDFPHRLELERPSTPLPEESINLDEAPVETDGETRAKNALGRLGSIGYFKNIPK